MKMYETQSGRDLDSAAIANANRRLPGGPRAQRWWRTWWCAADGSRWRAGSRVVSWIADRRHGSRDVHAPVEHNYMETGVLSALQLASMFPATVLENFYIKTRNSIEDGKTKAPYGSSFPCSAT
jgi:hypothetical protein